MKNVYRILIRRPARKRSLGTPVRRLENNIRKDLRVIGREVVGWIRLVSDGDQWRAFMNTC
jgi:hypothetical protein